MKDADYHNYDNKKPLKTQDDMRTAYYRGHRHIRDPPPTATFATVPQPEYVYSRPPRPVDKMESDYKSSYTFKPTDPDLIRNPRIELQKIRGMKDLDGRNYSSAPKPLNEYLSTTKKDYQEITHTPMEKPIYNRPQPLKIKPSKVEIDPSKPGFSKHLDFMATTNMLNYVAHTDNPLPNNNIITVWSWFGMHNKKLCEFVKTTRPLNVTPIKEDLCATGPADTCPRRRNEFTCMVKHVPHGGLTSENRENYKQPISKVQLDVQYVTPVKKTPRNSLVPYMGMSSIYGSGEPVDKFVSIQNYSKFNK